MGVHMLSDLILSCLANFVFISEEERNKQIKGDSQEMENYLTLVPGFHIFPPYRSERRKGRSETQGTRVKITNRTE